MLSLNLFFLVSLSRRIAFLKKHDRKNKKNNLLAEHNILKFYDSARSNKKNV